MTYFLYHSAYAASLGGAILCSALGSVPGAIAGGSVMAAVLLANRFRARRVRVR